MALPLTEDYPDVRAAIDISLDTVILPDSVISMAPYAEAAEAELARRVPGYSEDDARIQRAAIYLTAALLCPAVPHLIAERQADGQQYQRQPFDAAARAEALRALADAEINEVLGEDDLTAQRPTVFALACGRRGR
jgi:hypothetical protein